MILRTFGWSFGITALGLVAAFFYDGPTGLALVAVLAILEISLSFDNAVVNAKVLDRMSPFWQKIFLTVGIAIAVFGMRLVFPLLIVGITAKLGPVEAFDLALNDQHRYHELMNGAYPMIAAFGGMFLMMLFLNFVFEERAEKWLPWLEKPLARIGRLDQLAVVVAGGSLALVAWLTAENPGNVMIAGVLGMVTYILVNGLGELFSEAGDDDEDEDGADEDEEREAPAVRPQLAGAGHRQGRVLPLPLPGGAGRLVQLRRRHRRVRDQHRPDRHRAGPRHRRHVHPVPDRLPGPQGDPARVRLPGARRALGDRRPGHLHVISIGHHVPEWITGGLGAY